MGTDVWSEDGVVMSLGEMAEVIPQKGVLLVSAAIKKYIKTKVDKKYEKYFKDLAEFNGTHDDLIGALLELSRIHEKPKGKRKENEEEDDFFDNAYEYDHTGHILAIWRVIMKNLHPDLPVIGEIKVFENPRECGWVVPINEPCFIFDDSKLFKTVLSPKGNKFKKVFGRCEKTTWTVMSY